MGDEAKNLGDAVVDRETVHQEKLTQDRQWYVGAMNDAYCVIDKPPQPGPIDYFCTMDHKDVDVIMQCGTNKQLADLLVAEHNGRLRAYLKGLDDALQEIERFVAVFADVNSPTRNAAREIITLIRNLKKSPEEIAHEDSYWDDPLR